MNSIQAREALLEMLKREFPSLYFTSPSIKTKGERVSVTVAPDVKRWMQVDANPNYLSIAMDHDTGDITIEDISELGLQVGSGRKRSSIWIKQNDDAVNMSIYNHEPYDFNNEAFC